ncbi:J domain-containing protein [Dorea acetigenes]|jgi:curved DNA-binding protein CbpA|uniref:J domain-containing protein n=1 Tax=Dorea acetigenes TaxID=2981787 RepID=A0ABT2RMH3_9FIRM|nr:J domain-containing protein [Dorea acetigenes]MCB6413553.1 J domain-containing protein [Faecalimonas umbilicata]MCU6686617.1 J domain-containing protein [Dorea acetigenes]SCJ03033.1 Chaperone protein DnaJ [uncultured Clostridium sp.]
MKDCTYYDLLGIPMDATDEEITNAKNFLVKRLHPDANTNSGHDTTLYIQNVLDAYRILINPTNRRIYDRRIRNPIRREDRPVHGSRPADNAPLSPNFAPFWEAANKLNELVCQGSQILKQKRWGKQELSSENRNELSQLASEAQIHIQVLESGDIPKKYWFSHAMNWLLFQWSQHRDLSYAMLFSMYDSYLEQCKSNFERKKILNHTESFLTTLNKMMK